MPRVSVLMTAAALLTVVPLAYGQETQAIQGPEAVSAPAPRVAVPRSGAPAGAAAPTRIRREPAPRAAGRSAPGRREERAAAAPAAAQQRRAVPRGSRPRGDNPPTGIAVPRAGRPVPRAGGVYRGDVYRNRRVYRNAPRVYNNYFYSPRYYYPRRYYPYGYGGFGVGFFYYDPYRWYPASVYGGYYGAGHPGYGAYNYLTGELRLDVDPKHAEVYVDGYFAGRVDDFDGIFQGLRLEDGGYRIEIVAPGYEPLEFDVRILPGQKTTYRGELRPRP